MLGRPGDLSSGSKRARSQSEEARAGRLLRVRSEREAEPSSDPDPGCRLLSAAAGDSTSQVRPDVACAGPSGAGAAGLACRLPFSSDHMRGPSLCSGPASRDGRDPREPGTCSRGCPRPRRRAGLLCRGCSPVSCLLLRGDPRDYLGKGLEKMCVGERTLA